jgi:hypothetical protein
MLEYGGRRLYQFWLYQKYLFGGRTMNRATYRRLTIAWFWLVLIAFSYNFGTQTVYGLILPACKDCACRMALAWANDGDNFAQGMQQQNNTGVKVEQGLALAAFFCDPPNQQVVGTVDRYKYTTFARLCDNSQIRRPTVECSVSGNGTLLATGISQTKCVN